MIDAAKKKKEPQTFAGALAFAFDTSQIEVVARLVEGKNSDGFNPSMFGDCLSLISLVLMTFSLFMYSVSGRLPIFSVSQCEGHSEALGLDFPFPSAVS